MNDGKISMRWGAVLAVAGAGAVILIGALPSGVAAQRGRAEVNDGNRLYEEGRFGEAHEKYLEALRDAPDLPLALFNDGNALYQTEEYERALDAYRRATEAGDAALAAPAWYNLGNHPLLDHARIFKFSNPPPTRRRRKPDPARDLGQR